jgi:TetR/AcrR family transcriptional repressor of nem operon
LDQQIEQEDAGQTARSTFLAGYLSPFHRDSPALGCPAAALALDAAHAKPGGPLRGAYTDGLLDLIEGITRLVPDASGTDADENRALVELSTIVGAVVLARATAGSDVSDRILAEVRHHLTGENPA